ncbi:MAG TPA: TIGR03086 family metal-binding protein [Nitriliruptorales bacterium]
MDPVELFTRSRDLTNQVVAAAGDDAWGEATPCTEWSVRDVTNHLVVEMLWVPDILGGRTVDEVGDVHGGDQLGDDPCERFSRTSADAVIAWQDLDSLQQIVHLSFGDVPAFLYGVQMGTDMLVHGWDIAKGLGRDHELPDDLAHYAYDQNAPMITAEVRATGIIGPEVQVADPAPWGHRLLGLLGRDPAWSR